MKHRKIALLLLLLCLTAGIYVFSHNCALFGDFLDSREMSAEQFLYERLSDETERIYLASYQLTEEEFCQIWDSVQGGNPELFFVSPSYEYSLLNGTVFYVLPRYIFTGNDLLAARADYHLEIEQICSRINKQWSDLEKALYLHDWIVMNCAYDLSLEHHTAYDLLTSGTGICQAYAQTYRALLSACGIPCQYVNSPEMNHVWNMVKLDGLWYNVDVTYDDPTFDRLGHVQHHYFLVSTQKLNEDHYGGQTPDPGNSTEYDAALWREVTSAFVPIDGTFYCISGNQICRWETGALTPLLTIQDLWYVSGDPYAYWEGCYSSLNADGETLLYNTPTAIKRCNPLTGETETVFTYDGDGAIYGFVYRDHTAVCQISDSPNEEGRQIQVDLSS